MTPVKHPLCNDVLCRPPGVSEEECRDLHIMRDSTGVASFWQPNAEEIKAIMAGQPIILHSASQTHPPIWLGVAPAPTEHPHAG